MRCQIRREWFEYLRFIKKPVLLAISHAGKYRIFDDIKSRQKFVFVFAGMLAFVISRCMMQGEMLLVHGKIEG